VVLGVVILGGLFGLFQIPVWQACLMAGIVVGRVLTTWGQSLVIGWANRLSAMARFALQGGLIADDPGAVFAEVRSLPPLIGTEQHKLRFTLALFGWLPIFMYLLGRWRFRIRPTAFGPLLIYRVSRRRRLMACGLGVINGYLIARFLVPLLFPQPEMVIKVPSGEVVSILDENLALVLVGFVLILIVFGLQASGRSRG
jgi:hypothetical protein